MASNDFPVGSVVYFLATKTEKVLPAQVTERIDRTSVDGVKSTYIIAVRTAGDTVKKLEVDPSKINLFSSPDEMKEFMVSRATDAISILVEQAVAASSIFVPAEIPEAPVEDLDLHEMESWHIPAAERPLKNKKSKSKKTSDQDEGAQFAEIDLGDGKKARMRI